MRLPVIALFTGSLAASWLAVRAAAQDAPLVLDMRKQLSAIVKERLATLPDADKKAEPSDPEIVTLPPFLVSAPILRIPTQEDTLRVPEKAVGVVSYMGFHARDQRRHEGLQDALEFADLLRLSGDAAFSKQVRQEAYRSLTRQLTPLEKAMDRSINGGRY